MPLAEPVVYESTLSLLSSFISSPQLFQALSLPFLDPPNEIPAEFREVERRYSEQFRTNVDNVNTPANKFEITKILILDQR